MGPRQTGKSGFRLNVFARRVKRHLVQHPKFYCMDAGVFRTPRPKGPLDAPEEIGGAALEGLVAQQLRAWIAYGRQSRELFSGARNPASYLL